MSEMDIIELFRRLHGYGTPRWEQRMVETGAETPEYLEWLARECRERQTPEERAETERMARRFAANWALYPLASKLKVQPRTGPGPRRPSTGEVPALDALRIGMHTRAAPLMELGAAAGTGRELWDEPVSEYVPLPADLPSARYVALRVSGDSMTPLMHDGDRVLVKLGPAVARDRVIVARRPDDGYVIKRVGRIEPDAIELRSLNSAYPPFWLPRDDQLVLGTVVVRWCAHDPPEPAPPSLRPAR